MGCKDCLFFNATPDSESRGNTRGQCHRNPPQVVALRDPDASYANDIGVRTYWPRVWSNFWCGAWEQGDHEYGGS